ncbi:S41 family peptidase [Myroides sp. LJL116]
MSFNSYSQHLEDKFSKKKMRKDLELFKQIRIQANSGLYKYRTPRQIDSIYSWAESQINQSTTYLDFYTIICQLTDFEGSLHNDTSLSDKHLNDLKKEQSGYFALPLIFIDNAWRVNLSNTSIPLGSSIIAIDNVPIESIVKELYKYYTTDGDNTTGKQIGLRTHFAKFYRFEYGPKESFLVTYTLPNDDILVHKSIESTSYNQYYSNFDNRHSLALDSIYYKDLLDSEKYRLDYIDTKTAVLSIYSFSLGNEHTQSHLDYKEFLEQNFKDLKNKGIENLIVDIRHNNGGTDPNDLLTYSFLSKRNFQESTSAWISFYKIPYIAHLDVSTPKILRPLGIRKYNKLFQKRFPHNTENQYHIGEDQNEMQIWEPSQDAFQGDIYLLISPAVASAASLFAAMLSSEPTTITIGEESMGGYYGQNGHTSLDYKLPHSKIITSFSVDNITHDVLPRSIQIKDRGIMPDIEIHSTLEDFLSHKDTTLDYTLELIENKRIQKGN